MEVPSAVAAKGEGRLGTILPRETPTEPRKRVIGRGCQGQGRA